MLLTSKVCTLEDWTRLCREMNIFPDHLSVRLVQEVRGVEIISASSPCLWRSQTPLSYRTIMIISGFLFVYNESPQTCDYVIRRDDASFCSCGRADVSPWHKLQIPRLGSLSEARAFHANHDATLHALVF